MYLFVVVGVLSKDHWPIFVETIILERVLIEVDGDLKKTITVSILEFVIKLSRRPKYALICIFSL